MYSIFKAILLKLLKVPPEPNDPMGEVAMLKVFQPARGYLQYALLVYAIGQLIIWGVIGGLVALFTLAPKTSGHPLFIAISIALLAILLVQTFFSYAMVRLDYEMRWYKVTDRSLRIREGIWHVREMTMTFANIQNLTITQGPMQKLFGIADLKVQSAGGGGGHAAGAEHQSTMGFDAHTAYFRGVNNAAEIRDLMLNRLKHLKDVGLGDHDDRTKGTHPAQALPTPDASWSPEALGLLMEIHEEAKKLKAAGLAMRG